MFLLSPIFSIYLIYFDFYCNVGVLNFFAAAISLFDLMFELSAPPSFIDIYVFSKHFYLQLYLCENMMLVGIDALASALLQQL